jgi:NAD(P)-dependent dehydrogenase (short-subunit alcohol dehydrogenase family)
MYIVAAEHKDRVALITGAGRGLGEAICDVFAESGANIVAADIRRELAEGTAQRASRHGGRPLAIEMDVSDSASVESAVKRVVDIYGRLDIVVNNAGTDRTASIDELTVEDWDRVLATNLRGPFLLSKAALSVMRGQRSGHIFNITSTAAKRAWANASAYHASKWGLLGFSHALFVEAREVNVKVTAIVAGGMRTPFLLERFPDIDQSHLQDPRNVAETIRAVSLLPPESVLPEVMVLPMHETSWP